MKKTTKVILGSTMTIAMCASLIAGSTLAMFSSRSNVNVAITSGKVDVVASVDTDSLKAYSTVWNEGKMQYEEVKQRGDHFYAGGFYSYSAGALTFTNIAAGDAVEFQLNIENKSTLAIQYRVQLTVPEKTASGDAQGDLVKEMQVSFDGGDPVTIGDESTIAQKWSDPVDVGAPITAHTVKISVPAELEGNQGESCLLHVGVYAVQLGTHTSDPVGTYKAYTANDLIRLIDSSNYHSKTYAGETIALGADIDLSTASDGGASTLSIALADTPATIATTPQRENFYLADEFKGTLDGNGHKLSNFNVIHNSLSSISELKYNKTGAGLFRAMDGATVKNLILSNVTMETNSENTENPEHAYGFAGILAGAAKNSTIENVKVENSIVGSTTDYAAKCVIVSGQQKLCKTKEEAARGEHSELPLVAYDKLGALFGWVGAGVEVSNVNITLNEDAEVLTGNKLFGYVAEDASVTYGKNVTVTCVPAAGMEEVLTFTQESHEPTPTVSVGSAEGLASLTQSVQSGRDFSGMTITLTDDIDLSEAAPETIGAFKGTIDGGEEGYTISGLDLNYFSTVSSLAAAASVEEAPTIRNVTLEFTQFTGIDNWKEAYAFATHQDGVTSNISFVNGENLNLDNATIALVDEALRYELRYGTLTDEGNKLEEVAYIGLTDGDPETGEGYSETITNQHIIIDTATPVTYNNVKFEGDTYIWIQAATTLTMTGCYADVNPARVGNNSRAAFITSNTEFGTGTGVRFILRNNTILSAHASADPYSAAIFSWAYTGSSTFEHNIFGGTEANQRYNYVGVKLMNFMDGAYVTFTDNTVYGSGCNGFDLMQNNSRGNTYTAMFVNNTVTGDGCHFLWVEATGTSATTPGHGRVIVMAGTGTGEQYQGNNLNGKEIDAESFDQDTFKYQEVPASVTAYEEQLNKYEKYYDDEDVTRSIAFYQYSYVGWNVTYNDASLINAGTFAFGVNWNVDELISQGIAAEDNTIKTYDGKTSLTTNREGQILLGSAADLVALNEYLAEAQTPLTVKAVVTNDINMAGVEFSVWTGTQSANLTLDGQYHVIYGIDANNVDKYFKNTFFAHISAGSVTQNLYLLTDVSGSDFDNMILGSKENVMFMSKGTYGSITYFYKNDTEQKIATAFVPSETYDMFSDGAQLTQALVANKEQSRYQGNAAPPTMLMPKDVWQALKDYLNGIFGAYLN